MGQKQPKPDLVDAQIDMRMASRQIKREAANAEKSERAEKKKVAAAIAKGQLDVARIHAEGAIRNKHNAISLERLSAQLEAVASKIGSASMAKNVSEQIARSVPILQGAIHSMDKVELANSMEHFQKIFEDLEVRSADMGQSLDNVHQGSLDQGEVDTLVKQIAEEQNLQLGKEMGEAGKNRIMQPASGGAELSSLENRLNNLKQS
eukprot:TRINITY_DN1549_c0_g1_i3.p2 TRINITY_DN1549_c0_g1~~TRINITY_DN1549_c0_g1_i3.p2  ORF type:complete len:206 (+),score=56.75 TRINITY_DN1549_c0_g1_i3:1242-1859(+)